MSSWACLVSEGLGGKVEVLETSIDVVNATHTTSLLPIVSHEGGVLRAGALLLWELWS